MAARRTVRIGQAAELLDVSVETLRRWETAGRLRSSARLAGSASCPSARSRRLLAERRARGLGGPARPIVAQSARNHFRGIVTRIERDRVAAVVEVQCGPHRLVSLMTAEAIEDLGLKVGDEAICAIKATNVVVEVPG